MPDAFPTLKSERLLLRAFVPDDEAAFQQFAVKEDFWKFLPGPALDSGLVKRFIAARVIEGENPSGRHGGGERRRHGASGLACSMTSAVSTVSHIVSVKCSTRQGARYLWSSVTMATHSPALEESGS